MCSPTRWSPEVGDRVYWKYGENLPPRGRDWWHVVVFGRVASLGRERAMIHIDGRHFVYIAIRRLRRTHDEAEAVEYTPGNCPVCDAPLYEGECTESCREYSR